eukprot:506258-Prymnesium_polylepis.3
MAHMLHVADNELPSMSARILSFRTALLNVALEQMLLPTPPTLSLAHQQDNQVDGDVPLHVLVVDGSPEICASHSQRVLEVDPSARVSFCQRCDAAHHAPHAARGIPSMHRVAPLPLCRR